VYRQAVLKYAFEGKLTNKNVKDGELPKGWKWVKVSDVVDMQSGVAFKKSEYSKSGIRLFQIANVSFNYIKWEEIEHLPESYSRQYPELLLNVGDIVMALNRPMLNDQLKIAEIRSSDTPAILYQRVGRFIFQKGDNKKYFLYFLQSPQFVKWLKEQLRGVNIPFINKSRLLGYDRYPICSVNDQHRIVEEIESRLSVVDKLEETITASVQQSETLRQSILKKAFEGKLV
jgi:type I restriction enzyme S subunit